MRLLILLSFLLILAFCEQCTETLQVECIDDIRAAFPICKKAAEEKGKDTAADLACMKYFNKMKPECWPCICFVAHQEHLDIKGC